MEILTPYENDHYQFIAITDGHAYRMINPSGLVLLDNKLIARWVDGEYVESDGTNYGWMSFEEFVNTYGELHKDT